MMRRTIAWIAIAVILFISIHYFFLSRKAPKETYPDDTFLSAAKQKTALIIVAHDDDAINMAGTVTELCMAGWIIKELCFYNAVKDDQVNERTLQRQTDIVKVKEIEGLSDLIYFSIPYRNVANLSVPEYMPPAKEEFDKQYNRDTLLYYIRGFMNENKPSVIFSLDNNIGGYGHPDHVMVSRLVLEECMRRSKDSSFTCQYIYQPVFTPSMTEHMLSDIPAYKAALSAYGEGVPLPDVQVNITPVAVKKKAVMEAYTTEQNSIRKIWPYYNYYPAFVYFDLFNREFFKVIKLK